MMNKRECVKAPVSGKFCPINEVDEEMFKKEMLGVSYAIIPEEGNIYSPISGKVGMLASTKHAICIISESGLEVLIHVGIDTVELNGKYFDSLVKVNEEVKVGQPLLRFNLNKIKKTYDTTVISIITNSSEYIVEKKIMESINANDLIMYTE